MPAKARTTSVKKVTVMYAKVMAGPKRFVPRVMKAKRTIKAMKATPHGRRGMKATPKATKATKATLKAMKTMKAAPKAMKAMKAMKAKRVAFGPLARYSVLRGRRERTKGGLLKDDLTKNRKGKIVSKRVSELGKRAYKNVEPWSEALQEAKHAMGLSGMVLVGGKTALGQALYAKAKTILKARPGAARPGATAKAARAWATPPVKVKAKATKATKELVALMAKAAKPKPTATKELVALMATAAKPPKKSAHSEKSAPAEGMRSHPSAAESQHQHAWPPVPEGWPDAARPAAWLEEECDAPGPSKGRAPALARSEGPPLDPFATTWPRPGPQPAGGSSWPDASVLPDADVLRSPDAGSMP